MTGMYIVTIILIVSVLLLATAAIMPRLGPVVYLNGPDGRQSMPEGYKF